MLQNSPLAPPPPPLYFSHVFLYNYPLIDVINLNKGSLNVPIIKSAIKRAKQTVVRRERNVATKKALKEAVKAFNAAPSATTLSAAQSAIDTAVKKNVLNKNTASRRKALLAKNAKAAGVKPAAAKKAAAPKAAAPKAAAKPAAKKAPAKKPAAKK